MNLPREVWRVLGRNSLMLRLKLTIGQPMVIACQKSAEGIVIGISPARVLRHSMRNQEPTDKPNRSPNEGPNGPRR